MDKKAFSVKEFEQAYDVGHTVACEEIKSERLVSYKLGRRRYISVHAAEDWQRRLEAETNLDSRGANVATTQSDGTATHPVPSKNPVPPPRNPDSHHPDRPRKVKAHEVAA